MQNQAQRIGPVDAHDRLQANPEALLVCAYDEPEKFEQNHLQGAIPLDELYARTNSIPRNTEIILYCA